MEQTILYPTFPERFKAVVLDALVILAGLVAAGMIFSLFPNAPGYIRGAVFVLVFLLYEPILVSTGGTLGHRFFGLRVRTNGNHRRNAIFPLAILRSAVKWLLGWLSFLPMITNPQRRALHDMVSGSIVLYRENAESGED